MTAHEALDRRVTAHLPPSRRGERYSSLACPGGARPRNAFCAIHSPKSAKSANLLKVSPTCTIFAWNSQALSGPLDFAHPAYPLLRRRDARLSWLVTYRDGMPARRRSPISVSVLWMEVGSLVWVIRVRVGVGLSARDE